MDKGIIQKIQKLLALSQSPNQAEAESALEKAHAILEKYNLSMGDIRDSVMGEITEETVSTANRMESWREILMYELAWTAHCRMFRNRSYNHERGRMEYRRMIVGREANIATFQWMYEYLSHTITRKVQNIQGRRAKNSYRLGMVAAFQTKLRQIRENEREKARGAQKAATGDQKHELMVIENEIDLFLKRHYPNLKTQKAQINSQIDQGALNEGLDAGRRVSLSTQVGEKPKQGAYLEY
jgi:hypothetical protein